MVDTPLTLTYADLLALPQEERIVTLCCVSNEVGGESIGNAGRRGGMVGAWQEPVGGRERERVQEPVQPRERVQVLVLVQEEQSRHRNQRLQ